MNNKEFSVQLQNRLITFSVQIINFCESIPKSTTNLVLIKQIIRSATSIGANVIEGQGCNSQKDFLHFMTIALKSSIETKYWLTIFKKANIGNSDIVNNLYSENDEISNLLGSITKTLRVKLKT